MCALSMTPPAEVAFEAWSSKHKYDLVEITRSDNERTAIARFAWLAAWSVAQQQTVEACAKVSESEPEPEGKCPVDGLDPSTLALAAVKATKKSIAAAIRATLRRER